MNLKKFCVTPSTPILQTIKIIDHGGIQLALVVSGGAKLLGTVTDGDVRRAILRGVSLEAPVSQIMNPKPMTARQGDARAKIVATMRREKLRQIPIVGAGGKLVGLEVLDQILMTDDEKPNWVVIMAGGLGARLRPLTELWPKPMLPVGDTPILEIILTNFIEQGFKKFFLAVNYKAGMIQKYFGDGSRFGAEIRYMRETKRLGTAGGLSLLPESPKKPVIVMNGDLLTKVNFQQLIDFHEQSDATATLCIRKYDFQVPYGVVGVKRDSVLQIDEKPTQQFFVNAGIYVLEPEVLKLIPKNRITDMPELLEKLQKRQASVKAFPIREYWLDIGQMADFQKAQGEFA